MGKAPEIKSALRRNRSKEFVLDPETGLISENNPEPETTTKTAPPVQAAHQTYD